jgi:hypothetical protein
VQASKGRVGQQGPQQQQQQFESDQQTTAVSNGGSSSNSSNRAGSFVRKRPPGAATAVGSSSSSSGGEHATRCTNKKQKQSSLSIKPPDAANPTAVDCNSPAAVHQQAAASQQELLPDNSQTPGSIASGKHKGTSTASSGKQGKRRSGSSKRQPLAWRSQGKPGAAGSAAADSAAGSLKEVRQAGEDANSSSSSSSRKQQVTSDKPPPSKESQTSSSTAARSKQRPTVRVLTADAAPSTSSSSSTAAGKGSWYKRVQQPRQPKTAAAAAAEPALRNIKLRSFEELRVLVQQYGAAADLTTLLAMFSRLRTVPWHDAGAKAALLDQLWDLLKPHLQQQKQQQQQPGQQQPQQPGQQQQQRRRRHTGSPRHCAEAMLAASKLQHAPAGLYETCLAAFTAQVAAADPRVLSNAIYAVATAPHGAVSASCKQNVEQVLLPVFVRMAGVAASQSVANVAYAAALLGCRGVLLQQLLDAVPSSTWREANTQVNAMLSHANVTNLVGYG